MMAARVEHSDTEGRGELCVTTHGHKRSRVLVLIVVSGLAFVLLTAGGYMEIRHVMEKRRLKVAKRYFAEYKPLLIAKILEWERVNSAYPENSVDEIMSASQSELKGIMERTKVLGNIKSINATNLQKGIDNLFERAVKECKQEGSFPEEEFRFVYWSCAFKYFNRDIDLQDLVEGLACKDKNVRYELVYVLERMTGQYDFGDDQVKWQEWMDFRTELNR